MVFKHSVDHVLAEVHHLDRHSCVQYLRAFDHPRLDFTDDYLHSLSLEKLRHLLTAACEQAREETE